MISRDLRWSGSEKKIARHAFDVALESALAGIMAEFKGKAAAVTAPSEMWDIEDYLRRRRRKVDALFDYRYSQLCFVFAQLIVLGHLYEKQLAGLSDDKKEEIRHLVDRMRER